MINMGVKVYMSHDHMQSGTKYWPGLRSVKNVYVSESPANLVSPSMGLNIVPSASQSYKQH